MQNRLIFFCDCNHADHLYAGTSAQAEHLRDAEGGAPRSVRAEDIRLDPATGRVAFSYQNFSCHDVPVADAAFSIAPPHWATGGMPTEREWDTAGPDDTAASILSRRVPLGHSAKPHRVLTIPDDLYAELPNATRAVLATVAARAQQWLLASKHTGPVGPPAEGGGTSG